MPSPSNTSTKRKHEPGTILMTRFPYESILSGEEWHTLGLAAALCAGGSANLQISDFKFQISNNPLARPVEFLGTCEVLLEEFPKLGVPVHKGIPVLLPVSVRNLLFFTLLLPITVPALWIQFLWIKFRRGVASVYMLSLSEKLILTPFAKLLGCKVLWVEHQRFGRWMYANPYRFVYRLWAHMVHVVAVSPDHGKMLKPLKLPKERVHVIVNGVDTEVFSPVASLPKLQSSNYRFQISKMEGQKAGTLQELPLKSAPPAVGCVARMYADKGIDVLIRAFALVRKQEPEVRLHLLGEGPEKERLQELVRSLGLDSIVHFYTPYTDIPRESTPGFFRALDVAVLPSREHDPFGLVAAESMAVGTPTVVTDVCGIAGFLRHEHDAMIVPAENEQLLAEALLRVLQEPELAASLSHNGRETSVHSFSLERMVSEYRALL